jgi:hypothetical protein
MVLREKPPFFQLTATDRQKKTNKKTKHHHSNVTVTNNIISHRQVVDMYSSSATLLKA